MTQTVNRNAKDVCILVMLVINKSLNIGLSSKLNVRRMTDGSILLT